MPVTRSKGFTLIEIAIVITIIGMLMVGVTKVMTSLIQSAKVSSAITLAQDISVAVNAFKQQYHMLPGDMVIDPTNPEISNVRNDCWKGSNKGNNDGLINGNEPLCVPEVLFQAGLAKVDRDSNGFAVFQTSYGPVSVIATSLSAVGAGKFPPSIIHVVEFQNLPCDVAISIDSKMDDGDTTNGNVKSSPPCVSGASGIPATTTLDVPL